MGELLQKFPQPTTYLWELVRIHTGGIAHEHAEMVCRAGEAPAPTVFRFDFVGAVSPDEKG